MQEEDGIITFEISWHGNVTSEYSIAIGTYFPILRFGRYLPRRRYVYKYS
jgi:hypothetical protein